MLISIIVPVYNVEKYLNRCIESLRQQNYSNIEIILVNDGSTDSSGIICDKYSKIDNRIKVIHKKNGGLSSARNVGVNIANGEYITFVDSDDFWLPNKLNDLVSKLEKDNLDMLLFKALSYYETTNTYKPFSKEYDESYFEGNGQNTLSKILEKDYDFGWCAVFYIIKRENILNNNLEFLEGYLCEDVNYIFKLWNISKNVGYYNDFVYAYRRENNNSITHIASFKFCNDLLEMISINLRLFKEYNINKKLKNVLYLNMQTLIHVVLFWLWKYSRLERKELIKKIVQVKKVFKIENEYKYIIKKKEKIIVFLLNMIGPKYVGFIWMIKNKIFN